MNVSSGASSPGQSRTKGRKTVVAVVVYPNIILHFHCFNFYKVV